MKRIEVVIDDADEGMIGEKILKMIYEALQGYGYIDVSVKAETVVGLTQEIKIPAFLQQYTRKEGGTYGRSDINTKDSLGTCKVSGAEADG